MKVFSISKIHLVRIIVVATCVLFLMYWLASKWAGTLGQSSYTDPRLKPLAGQHLKLTGKTRPSSAGLRFKDGKLLLENKPLHIISGAMHYFRVVPEYWRDRMLKMKAAGLNTLETYVPWNLHEEIRGQFNFDGILDIRKYIMTAKEVGLHVIVRPGPYICSEWDFGGLPSWLLHDPMMQVRSTYKPYLRSVDLYLQKLGKELRNLQYMAGGPIIAFQIENEFGTYNNDQAYLQWLQEAFERAGFTELLFTSDDSRGISVGSIPGVWATGNLNEIAQLEQIFSYLRKARPSDPLMVMEFWTGWFDHWGEPGHHRTQPENTIAVLNRILKEGSGVNFYMFHGGTNFGFMAGANVPYQVDTTSYDYDAPLTEHGATTTKYHIIRNTLQEFFKTSKLPPVPPNNPAYSYGVVKMGSFILLEHMVNFVQPLGYQLPVYMESLDINHSGGQGYGFTLYSRQVPKGQKLKFEGNVYDRAQVLVNGIEEVTLDWRANQPTMDLKQLTKSENRLDILVENMGRVNYADFQSNTLNLQRKGLSGKVHLDDKLLEEWDIYPLELRKPFLKQVLLSDKWVNVPDGTITVTQPTLVRASLLVKKTPKDTFLHMDGWGRGVVFINGFNLGRYWSIGPQQTLYVPAPLLKEGENQILIFELHRPHNQVTFLEMPILG